MQQPFRYMLFGLTAIILCTLSAGFSPLNAEETNSSPHIKDSITSAEALLGERLFRETRFAHLFYQAVANGLNINDDLQTGDPQLNKTYRFFGLPPYQIPFTESRFRGESFSCRSCHLVNEHAEQKELGMRSYADFASRSPLPDRSGQTNTFTVRNTPILVGLGRTSSDSILHYDGEFSSLTSLIVGTLTGRNLGWLPQEFDIAKQHLCRVIKNDDGNNALANDFGKQTYAEVFTGLSGNTSPSLKKFEISSENRIDVHNASCDTIVQQVAFFITQYLDDLKFSQNDMNLSPYDRFLKINQLPNKPNITESNLDYAKRLLTEISTREGKGQLKFVSENPKTESGGFLFHQQIYQFSKIELQGLKIFFQQSTNSNSRNGNCVACHPPPHFTDFRLHNIGVTQIEYEAIHGPGTFFNLAIPSLEERGLHSEDYLPATHDRPNRKEIFRQSASKVNPIATDLGAWNIFYNKDFPDSQTVLFTAICQPESLCSDEDQALRQSIARFKTPSLRNLGHSAPYMHNGLIGDLHAVIGFYISASAQSRNNQIRNADLELSQIRISSKEIIPLTQFLISLYEDYE